MEQRLGRLVITQDFSFLKKNDLEQYLLKFFTKSKIEHLNLKSSEFGEVLALLSIC